MTFMRVISTKKRSRGIALIEAVLATFVFGMAVVAFYSAFAASSRSDQGRAVGRQYAQINQAVGQYMSTYYRQLKSLSPGCSVQSLGYSMSHSVPKASCSMAVTGPNASGGTGVTVANGFQPTVQELIALGFLKAGTLDSPALDALSVVAESRSDGAATTTPTRQRFFTQIEQRCIPNAVNSSLQGRYVLVRHANGVSGALSLDEIEIIVNGVNVAPQAVISVSDTYGDTIPNASSFYDKSNLVDGRLTTAAANSVVNNAYVLPGLYRSSSNQAPWVLFDLLQSRTISSIGLRSADGPWESEGNQLAVVVGQSNPSALATNWSSLVAVSTNRWAQQAALVPGNKQYLSASDFSLVPPADPGLAPGTEGCPGGTTVALSSLVFNTQPFMLKSVQGSGAQFAAVVAEIGGDGAMSDPINGGELRGNAGAFVLTNPVRDWRPTLASNPSPSVGIAGIIAVRNGYSSYSTDMQMRADGTTAPTADWQFGGQNLTNVNHLASNSASVDSDLGVGGNISANTGQFINSLKLPVAGVGGTCYTNRDSLAQAGSMILMCNSGKWTNILGGTVNSAEFYEIDMRNISTGLVGDVVYCVAYSCQPSSASAILSSYATFNNVQTKLNVSQWFPVIVGYQQNTTPPYTISNFKLEENSLGWVILVNAALGDGTEFKVRFYKINS